MSDPTQCLSEMEISIIMSAKGRLSLETVRLMSDLVKVMREMTTEEQALYIRDIIYIKNTGKRPRRWIDQDNTLLAMGINPAQI